MGCVMVSDPLMRNNEIGIEIGASALICALWISIRMISACCMTDRQYRMMTEIVLV